MKNSPEQIVCDVIKKELDLCEDQVWVRNQNHKIPNDKRMYVVVGQTDSQIISNVNTPIPTDAGMDELQQIVARENLMIDLFGVTDEPRLRRLEVLLAINSVYSEQAQELNDFKIFPVSTSFTNTTAAEGGSMLNRFSILISCHVWYRKQKSISNPTGQYYNGDYYDHYPVKVTNDTDGTIIEFTTE